MYSHRCVSYSAYWWCIHFRCVLDCFCSFEPVFTVDCLKMCTFIHFVFDKTFLSFTSCLTVFFGLLFIIIHFTLPWMLWVLHWMRIVYLCRSTFMFVSEVTAPASFHLHPLPSAYTLVCVHVRVSSCSSVRLPLKRLWMILFSLCWLLL